MNTAAIQESQPFINNKLSPVLIREPKFSSCQESDIAFLSNVSDTALATLVNKAKTKSYPKHALILMEGEETSDFFIVLSGKVRSYISNEKSKEMTLDIQGAGSFFGEIFLLPDEAISVSIRSLEKTVCAVISKNDFNHWLMHNPDVIVPFCSSLFMEIRQKTNKVRLMRFSTVYERLIQTLQQMAVIEGNTSIIHCKPTQEDLASMVGASREMVSRIMGTLTKGGYVEVAEKTLILNKKLPSAW